MRFPARFRRVSRFALFSSSVAIAAIACGAFSGEDASNGAPDSREASDATGYVDSPISDAITVESSRPPTDSGKSTDATTSPSVDAGFGLDAGAIPASCPNVAALISDEFDRAAVLGGTWNGYLNPGPDAGPFFLSTISSPTNALQIQFVNGAAGTQALEYNYAQAYSSMCITFTGTLVNSVPYGPDSTAVILGLNDKLSGGSNWTINFGLSDENTFQLKTLGPGRDGAQSLDRGTIAGSRDYLLYADTVAQVAGVRVDSKLVLEVPFGANTPVASGTIELGAQITGVVGATTFTVASFNAFASP